MPQAETPMTTVAGRPTKVAHLAHIGETYVLCRLASGEDVHVPLKEIYALFAKEIVRQVRTNSDL